MTDGRNIMQCFALASTRAALSAALLVAGLSGPVTAQPVESAPLPAPPPTIEPIADGAVAEPSVDLAVEPVVEPALDPALDPTLEQAVDPAADPIGDLISASDAVEPTAVAPPPVAVVEPMPPRDPFLIEAVPVDASGPNTVAARERGLDQGRMAAYRRLIRRLLPVEAQASVANLSQADVIDLVQEFSVANERSSAVRYLADLTIKFNPSSVRALFGSRQVPFAEIPSRPLIVVPVARLDAALPAVLWGDPDPWLSAFSRLPPGDGLVPLVMPLGDMADIAALTADQALAGDVDALRAFAEARGGDGVVLAVVEPSLETPDAVQAMVSEFRNGGGRFDITLATAGRGLSLLDPALDQAAAATLREVEEAWKRRTQLEVGVAGEIVAISDIAALADWLSLKTKLRNVPIVNRVDLQAITRSRVQVAVAHAGTTEQLRAAMALQALDLAEADGIWMIAVRGARPADSASAPPAF